MASRKQLKKTIKHITGELFADCVALLLCNQGDKDKLHGLMQEVLDLHSDYTARLSHTERGSERIFYKKLRTDFTARVNDLSDRIIKA